jgi:hypothetical protein
MMPRELDQHQLHRRHRSPETPSNRSHPAAGTCRSNAFRPSNAHPDLQHLLVSEFECSNSGATAQEVIIEQGPL